MLGGSYAQQLMQQQMMMQQMMMLPGNGFAPAQTLHHMTPLQQLQQQQQHMAMMMQHQHMQQQQEQIRQTQLAQAQAQDAMFKEDTTVAATPPDHGFAKIIGTDFEHVIRTHKVQLGRRMPDDAQANPHVVAISDAKNISRLHAEIAYIRGATQEEPGHWQIVCHGKNGMYCNDEYKETKVSFQINHKDLLRFGETQLFFLQPIENRSKQKIRNELAK